MLLINMTMYNLKTMKENVRKRISELPSPAFAGVVREKTALSAIAEIKNAIYDGADMIDLHLSTLENLHKETLKKIISHSNVPVLALDYNASYAWEHLAIKEEERVNHLLNAVEAGASAVDIQGYTFDALSRTQYYGDDSLSFSSLRPMEVVTDKAIIAKQMALIDSLHAKGVEVLLSCHPKVKMSAEQVLELALFLERRNPDIIKIVTVSENENDVIEGIKATKLLKEKLHTKFAYHLSGETGSLSRIMNPLFGSHIVFCVDRFNEGSTMEQLDLKTARAAFDSLKRIRG